MSDRDSSNQPEQKMQSLLKLLNATVTLPAQVTFYASALAAIALIPGVTLPPALMAVASGIGVNALSSILERVARGETPDEKMCQQIQAAIDESGIATALQAKESQAMIAKLFRQLDVVNYAIQNNEFVILRRLSEQAEQYGLLIDELRTHLSMMSEKLGDLEMSQLEMKALLEDKTISVPLFALHSLLAPPADFVGREPEIEQILHDLEGETRAAISGIAGMGGVGKTALALVVAHRLASHYSDAQVMFDLRGTSRVPLSSTDVMQQIIHRIEPLADLRQKTDDELAALYRTLLSDKRALIILDNAANAEQVKPLLPPQTCALLVTSRYYFTLPGLIPLRLNVMLPMKAKEFLMHLCPRIGEYADEIAELCGYLPLALRITGCALQENIGFPVNEYVSRLRDRRTRLMQLKSQEQPEMNVEATFELSYELLRTEMQARWRSLAVFSGLFDRFAVANVWSLDAQISGELLSELVRYSLLNIGKNQ